MTTIVNTTAPQKQSGEGIGMIIGFIVIITLGLLFLEYGLPAIRKMGSPQINVPSKIDVNINSQTK